MFRWSFGYFYPESDYQMIDAIKYLVKANLTAFEVSQVMAICLNAFMCIDLYLNFINPFYPGERRIKWYLAGTAFITLLFGLYAKPWLLYPEEQFFQAELPRYLVKLNGGDSKLGQAGDVSRLNPFGSNGGLLGMNSYSFESSLDIMAASVMTGRRFISDGPASLANAGSSEPSERQREQLTKYITAKVDEFDEQQRANLFKVFTNTAFITFYMVIAFFSIGFALKTIAKSSIGSDVQNQYLKRHMCYVYWCVLIWTGFLANCTY